MAAAKSGKRLCSACRLLICGACEEHLRKCLSAAGTVSPREARSPRCWTALGGQGSESGNRSLIVFHSSSRRQSKDFLSKSTQPVNSCFQKSIVVCRRFLHLVYCSGTNSEVIIISLELGWPWFPSLKHCEYCKLLWFVSVPTLASTAVGRTFKADSHTHIHLCILIIMCTYIWHI